MARISSTKIIGGTYYAQVAVPLELQAAIGVRTKERSLRTKSAAEAKRLVRPVLDEWDRLFDDTRRKLALAKERAGPSTNSQIIARAYRDEIDMDTALRDQDYRYAAFDVDPDVAREFRDGAAGKLPDRELDRLVGPRIDRLRAAGKTNYRQGSPEWRELAIGLSAVVYEAMARQDERNNGVFTGTPTHPATLNMEPIEEPVGAGESVMELFDVYARENAKGVSADTLVQARRDLQLFADTTGTLSARKIAKKHVREWKSLLMNYPVKAAEISVFRGMTMKQIVTKNVEVKKPTILDGTVNRYLSALGAFSDWLIRNDYLDRNPVEGLYQSIDKTARTKATFTVDQMNILFASPLFAGCQNDDDWHKPGNTLIRDHRYWLPLVMLYSGARPAEIAQLAVADVREQHGQWILHITSSEDGAKSVKTKGSMRVVPVHPELIKLGFIKYRDTIKASGEARLFPLAQRNVRGQMVADFSRDFGRYLTRIGIKSGRGLSLYSLRHGFIDALRRAEFLDEHFGFLVGHGAYTMTGQYGTLPQGMLRQRVEMVDKVAYPGLKLAHLRPPA